MKTENTRIFAPLSKNHPLITDAKCWICSRKFVEGQRVCLSAVCTSNTNIPDPNPKVEQRPMHATCAYRGAIIYAGNTCYTVDRIADNGEYPVVTTDGKKFRFDEVGLEGK